MAGLFCLAAVLFSSCLPYGGIAPIWQFLSILSFGLALISARDGG